jgi:hypothetical protein
MSASQPLSRPDVDTRLLAGVSVPDTPLIFACHRVRTGAL